MKERKLFLFSTYKSHWIWVEIPEVFKFVKCIKPAKLNIDMKTILLNQNPFRILSTKPIFDLNLPFETESRLRIINGKIFINDTDMNARWVTLAEIMKT